MSQGTKKPINKVTPFGDLSWYIKWSASLFVLTAVLCRSVPEVDRIYDLVFSFVGCAGWFTVGMLWHDRALITLNAILCTVLGTGIMNYFFAGIKYV